MGLALNVAMSLNLWIRDSTIEVKVNFSKEMTVEGRRTKAVSDARQINYDDFVGPSFGFSLWSNVRNAAHSI